MKFLDTIEKKINKCNSSFNLKSTPAPKVQKVSISRPYPVSNTPSEIAAKIIAKNGSDFEAIIQSTDPLTYTETHSTFDIVSNSETAVNSWDGDSSQSYLSQMTFDTPYASCSTQTRPSNSFLEVHLYPVPGQPQIPFLAYPEVLPQSPRAIIANRKVYAAHVIARRTQKRNLVTYNASEGPLEALYQLYELLLLDRLQEIQMAAKKIFYNYSWTIAEIQNPVYDPDRERYTVLACMLHLLVKTFNENIAAGVYRDTPAHLLPGEKMALRQGTTKVKFEAVPKWAQNVPPLDIMLVIPYCKYQDGQNYHVVRDWADERACTIFKTKRILLWEPNMNWRA